MNRNFSQKYILILGASVLGFAHIGMAHAQSFEAFAAKPANDGQPTSQEIPQPIRVEVFDTSQNASSALIDGGVHNMPNSSPNYSHSPIVLQNAPLIIKIPENYVPPQNHLSAQTVNATNTIAPQIIAAAPYNAPKLQNPTISKIPAVDIVQPNAPISTKGPLRAREIKTNREKVLFKIGDGKLGNRNIETPNARGPIKAIYQDTTSAIINDVPQAVANTLPWVDKERKNQPYDQVLNQVSDSLNRAKSSDPEWIKPAQAELFELARKIDDLSNPPQYKEEYRPTTQVSGNEGDNRPFHNRPIWPGSRVNGEIAQRPIVITSNGIDNGHDYGLQRMPYDDEDAKSSKQAVKETPHKPVAKAHSKSKSSAKKPRPKSLGANKCVCKPNSPASKPKH